MYLVFFVNITLLRCTFVVVSDTISVAVIPGYFDLLPPAVNRKRYISVLFDRILATGFMYEYDCLVLST